MNYGILDGWIVNDIEIQSLTVHVENQEWTIYRMYAHVDNFLEECNWDFVSDICGSDGKCLIAGVFNT